MTLLTKLTKLIITGLNSHRRHAVKFYHLIVDGYINGQEQDVKLFSLELINRLL